MEAHPQRCGCPWCRADFDALADRCLDQEGRLRQAEETLAVLYSTGLKHISPIIRQWTEEWADHFRLAVHGKGATPQVPSGG